MNDLWHNYEYRLFRLLRPVFWLLPRAWDTHENRHQTAAVLSLLIPIAALGSLDFWL